MSSGIRKKRPVYLTQKARRKQKKQKGKAIHTVPFAEATATSCLAYPALVKQTQNEISQMKKSSLARGLSEYIKEQIIEDINELQNNDAGKGEFVKLSKGIVTVDFACFGLGNFSQHNDSMLQLSLLSSLIHSFNCHSHSQSDQNDTDNGDNDTKMDSPIDPPSSSGGYTFAWQRQRSNKAERVLKAKDLGDSLFKVGKNDLFEPVLTVDERKILSEVLKFNLLTEDTQGRYETRIISSSEDTITSKVNPFQYTVLFMPHCPRTLYNNVLRSNFTAEQLSKMFVIGNSFDQYSDIFIGLSTLPERASLSYVSEVWNMGITTEVLLDRWLLGCDEDNECSSSKVSSLKSGGKSKKNHSSMKSLSRKRKKKRNQRRLHLLLDPKFADSQNAFAFESVIHWKRSDIKRKLSLMMSESQKRDDFSWIARKLDKKYRLKDSRAQVIDEDMCVLK